jgi:hypothetical protein
MRFNPERLMAGQGRASCKSKKDFVIFLINAY